MNVLVVDDDDIIVEMVSKALTDAGHQVSSAHDGKEALKLLHERPIRIVISDWLMPGMDGLEFCRKVRSGGFEGYVYIILLTGKHRTEDVVEGLSAGADDFVSKPFSTAELLVRVKAGERIVSLETRHLTIFAMAKLTESRDPETGFHLERIRNYAHCIATHLLAQDDFRGKLRGDYIETIYLTSPLHDVGKVGIPDSILLKPGRLTDKEFNVMKRHTLIGGETLGAASARYKGVEYLRMAADIAIGHHERFDGSGYPRGLAGREIPLCSRITALADVYDALVAKRVYKAAIPHDVAREIILKERGRHFDPNVVDAFFATEEQFIETCRAYSDERAVAS